MKMTESTQTFTVTVERRYETDFTDKELAHLLSKSDADSEEEVIATLLGMQETEEIGPTEKLINLEVDVDGPSDD